MRSKLIVLILAIAAGALLLLIARHQRMQADHEMAAARLRIIAMDNQLWELRARIAQRITPHSVAEMAADLGELRPLGRAMWDGPASSEADEPPTNAPQRADAHEHAERRRP